jgi:predicted CXXCH cytochrome family protein
VVLGAAVVLLWGLPRGPVQAREAPETLDPDASCVDSECHTEIGERSVHHWEDLVDECEECHSWEDDQHEFEIEEAPELCLTCHDPVTDKKVVHEAAEEGGCVDCHDPHGSDVEKILLSEQEELCFDCHDQEEVVPEEWVHGPVDSGECTGCHDPHSSRHRKLLRAVGMDLCAECHEEVVESVRTAKFVHDPVEDGCTDCHDPHSGPFEKMLPAEGSGLCNECHDDIVEEAQAAPVDHEPVLTKDECSTCHSPHASNTKGNLKEPQVDLCLGCHGEPIETEDRTLADLKTWLERNPEWHEPIRKDGCSECHQPHGSENYRLLADLFPARFYSPFALDNYGLCFTCHDPPLVTHEKTRTMTNFRDGDRNLHFLHVNKEQKGRTCRACHDMHAATNGHLLRDRVRFGKWNMPIKFRAMENGGSCAPGCHATKTYDRDRR